MANWQPTGRSLPPESFGDLKPIEVLWKFNGPKLFTCKNPSGNLLLVHECDEDEGSVVFLVVPFSDELLAKVKSDQLPIREALDQPHAAAVLVGYGWKPQAAWAVSLGDLPNDMLPEPQVTFRYADAPLLSVRLLPAKTGTVTASVIQAAAARPIAALKRLTEYIESTLKETTAVAARTLRRFRDPPAVKCAFGSFEIVFGRPRPEEGNLVVSADDRRTEDDVIVAEMNRLFQLGLRLAHETRDDASEVSVGFRPNYEEAQAALSAIYELSPPETGIIDEIQIGGAIAIPGKITRLSKTTRGVAKAELSDIATRKATPPLETLVLFGIIEATDLGVQTLTLRQVVVVKDLPSEGTVPVLVTPIEKEFVFEMDESAFELALECQRQKIPVLCVGRLTPKGNYELIHLQQARRPSLPL